MSSIYYYRKISEKIQNLSKQFSVIVLTGARQTGKTTLLKTVFPDFNYISLDLPSLAEQAEVDPQQFLFQNPSPLIVDEAQYAPGLFRHLKRVVDQNRDIPGQYILTGSQKFNLMKEVSDSLAGRAVWLELEGLSIFELSSNGFNHHDLPQLFNGFIRGSLPELWQKPEMDAHDYYRTYLATYLERDVRQIVNVGNLRDFERFIRVCASRNGQLLNKTDISKDVGVTLNTINQWLSVLEACNQISFLEPYFGSTGKRVVKSPKLYFSEVGMLCFLLGLDSRSVQTSAFMGNIWETFIFAEFRKWIRNQNINAHLWFYRDNRAREVDFLVESGGKLDLFEVKWKTNPDHKDAKTMNAVYDDLKEKNTRVLTLAGKKHIIARSPNPWPLGSDVQVINCDYFVSED